MSVSERQSQDIISRALNASRKPEIVKARTDFNARQATHDEIYVAPCIDSRYDPASKWALQYGPALGQLNSFAGSVNLERLSRLLWGGARGIVFAPHWDEGMMDARMGFAGCGARTAKQQMEDGEVMHISAARFIGNINPHCTEGAITQTLEMSGQVDIPCYAIGVDHRSQNPEFLAVAEQGKMQYQAAFDDIRNHVVRPIPKDIQKRYPDGMGILRQAESFARIQTDLDKMRRITQDPPLVLITRLRHATDSLFGESLGKIMRIDYLDDGERRKKLPTEELDHLMDHVSYPLYMATIGGHGFQRTRSLLIEGRYHEIWNRIREGKETQEWLKLGGVVMGTVFEGNRFTTPERLH